MTAMFAAEILCCKCVRAGFWSVIASSCRTSCVTVLGMSGAKQSLATRLVAHYAHRHLPLGLRFRSASDQSGRQALAVYVAHIPLLSGTRCSRDVHPWSRSLSRDSPRGNRHKQDVEEDCRSP